MGKNRHHAYLPPRRQWAKSESKQGGSARLQFLPAWPIFVGMGGGPEARVAPTGLYSLWGVSIVFLLTGLEKFYAHTIGRPPNKTAWSE